jgi:hypothetical protein
MNAIAGRVPARDARFFARMSWIMLACVLLAFPLTYFGPLLSGTKSFIALRHLHGAAFFAWIGLYAWQSQLVAGGKVVRHRSIGLFGLALTGAMLPLGVWMFLTSTHERALAGHPHPYELTFYSIFDITAFGALVIAAVATAMRKTDWHKRFMYAAAIALVGPAISRWFLLVPTLSPWTDMGPNLLADLLFLPLMLYDRKALGRIHPATLIAIVAIVPMHVIEPWIAASAWWNALAPGLLGGGPG